MKFDGLAGLKYFIKVKINECVDECNNFKNLFYKFPHEAEEEQFFKGKFTALKEILDLIDAFEKGNEKVVFEEDSE